MASTSTEDLPNWAGLTKANIDLLSSNSKRKKLMAAYTRNQSEAKTKRSQLPSCMDASFVQKLDPWYVTNCYIYYIYIAYSQLYLTPNFFPMQ